jgi:hypothetical protein
VRAAIALLALCQAHAAGLPAHPRLLLDRAEVARLKARVAQPEWSAAWKAFRAGADTASNATLELPPRGGNWWHWYVCPRHGARLITGRRLGPWEWEHTCPVDGEVFHGDPAHPDRDFDGCAISGVHDGYAREVRDAGILFQVTGKARYAERGRAILLAYAQRYLSYALHDTQGRARIGGGRVGPQTLDEAVWLIPMAQGADLLWDALSEADRRTIADKLFLPAAREVILPHQLGIHNIQCWKNSAVGLAGFLLGDDELVRAAIDDPDRGYRAQMARGVRADGAWFEGAWGYHFYTLSALWPLTEAARHAGIDLYGEPLKLMFEAPVRLAMPNLVLPAFNDSAETPARNPLYELAWARYRDPLYLAALAGSKRTSEFALWYGADRLPDAAPPAQGSRNSEASGYAILERGAGAGATWLCLKYGPHGGGHGHPDKNGVVLYAGGRVIFPDPGTRPYGSPLHGEWDRATLAHSTLVVDSASQAEAAGRSLAFGSSRGVDYAMTDAGFIYPGVRFVRTAAMLSEKLIVFVDRITSEREHTFDLVVHATGPWGALPPGEPFALPARDGHQHLRDATARPSSAGRMTLPFNGGSLVLAGGEPATVITATGPGGSTEDRVPAALFRRSGREATYVWAVALDGAAANLETRAEANGAVTVRAAGRSVTVDTERATVRVTP